ncbi:hypothetical protein TcasGA2_TC011213 [Tribolium castaneum]|uniref:Uncharacterized protein n=1 Tax=Tribolium castaneum TaxID=7070 RepID=D6X3Q3_TRICA|nr:hypothetical protein TcasGA2_TC011213 [Tribolium castaneum]
MIGKKLKGHNKSLLAITLALSAIILSNGVRNKRAALTMDLIFALTHRIKVVVTRTEAQFPGKRGEEVKECPGDDHHVINSDQCDHNQSAVTQAGEERSDVGEGLVRAQAGVLTHDELQKEQRHAHEEDHDDVRHEKGTYNREVFSWGL